MIPKQTVKFRIVDDRFVIDMGVGGLIVTEPVPRPHGVARRNDRYVRVPGAYKRYASIERLQREHWITTKETRDAK